MTRTEVLEEIRKMPAAERRQVRDELRDEPSDGDLRGLNEKQQQFIKAMMKKGSITQLPRRLAERIEHRKFKRITVTGEPISETIIRERR